MSKVDNGYYKIRLKGSGYFERIPHTHPIPVTDDAIGEFLSNISASPDDFLFHRVEGAEEFHAVRCGEIASIGYVAAEEEENKS